MRLGKLATSAAILLTCAASVGCECIMKVGVESMPAGARVYVRGDTDVSFSPVPKMAGNVHGVMTTPDNLTWDFVHNPHARNGIKEAVWVKVLWADGSESESVKLQKCENARLVFKPGVLPEKTEVQVVSERSRDPREIVVIGGCSERSGATTAQL